MTKVVLYPFCYHELRLSNAAANNMVHLSPTTVFDVQTLAAYAIFLTSYLVLELGKFPGLKIDRAGAAIIGAVGMVAFRIVPPADTLRFIDFPTLVLLFSMMLIVGNLHLVGFFSGVQGTSTENEATQTQEFVLRWRQAR